MVDWHAVLLQFYSRCFVFHGTAGGDSIFLYVRLHGHSTLYGGSYSAPKAWAARICKLLQEAFQGRSGDVSPNPAVGGPAGLSGPIADPAPLAVKQAYKEQQQL